MKDLAGNVWEWTSSSFDAASRVGRGGDWFFINPQFVSAAHRYRFPASNWRNGQLGFRCARIP